MPSYSYQCYTQNGGCGNKFVLWTTISKYKPDEKLECPSCHTTNAVDRDYSADFSTIGIDMGPKTVGSFAERKTSKMSEDAKKDQWKKDHEYLFTEKPDLPEGMSYMPGEVGNREVSTEQKRHPDKKYKSKKNRKKLTR